MPGWLSADLAIQASYFITAVLFIMGLKRMSSPVTARSGITWAGSGMAVASAMPAPAQRMPLRALTGELMRLSPTMNRNAVSR